MAKTEFFVKMFDGIVRFRDVASIVSQSNRNGKISFYANIGYDGKGATVRRSLGQDKDLAYSTLAELNHRIAEGKFSQAANIFEVSTDLQIKAALRELEGYGATLQQVVTFYKEHNRPSGGHLTIEQAEAKFLDNLKQLGRSAKYINTFKGTYLKPFVQRFGNKRVIDVTLDDAESYIHTTKKNLSSASKADHISKLRVFFYKLAGLKHIKKEVNPFAQLSKPQSSQSEKTLTDRDRILNLSETYSFLDYLYKQALWDILLNHILVMFCGVRMEETFKMDWSFINLETRKIEITAKIAKKRRRRVIDIPEKAYHWIVLCHQKLDGEWTKRTESGFKQKMKRIKHALRDKKKTNEYCDENCPFEFHQNFARVTFVSNSYAFFGPEKTIRDMGHTGNHSVIHTNYREVVSKQDAYMYFQISPMKAVDLPDKKEGKLDIIAGD